MAKQEVKYDGTFEEMFRLGLVYEAGTVNNKRRNEFNRYMSAVWHKDHPDEKSPYTTEYPDKENLEGYFEKSTQSASVKSKVSGHDR